MGPGEVLFLMGVGGAFVAMAAVRAARAGRRRRLGAREGLAYARRGLEELPRELQESLLFRAADGGHERDVLSGTRRLGEHRVPFFAFDFAFQREVRGEWSYIDLEPPFRILSPLTVLAWVLPRSYEHVVLKRRGAAEDLTESELEVLGSVASLSRGALGLERAIGVAPSTLLRPVSPAADLDRRYLVWAPDRAYAAHLLAREVRDLLLSSAAGRWELVFEVIGPLALLYCAREGALEPGDALAMAAFGDELCRRLTGPGAESPRGHGV